MIKRSVLFCLLLGEISATAPLKLCYSWLLSFMTKVVTNSPATAVLNMLGMQYYSWHNTLVLRLFSLLLWEGC
uniref:Secreted protein n=1 Tax=Arundo donax TaxID=35708 RepID=A0A0A9ADI0_ARUDO